MKSLKLFALILLTTFMASCFLISPENNVKAVTTYPLAYSYLSNVLERYNWSIAAGNYTITEPSSLNFDQSDSPFVVDSNGYLHGVALIDNGTDHELQYVNSTDDGVTWNTQDILYIDPIVTGIWMAPSIAISPTDMLGIVVSVNNDTSGDRELWFTNKTVSGASWAAFSLVSIGGGLDVDASALTCDANDVFHVVFADSAGFIVYDLYYTNSTGGLWSIPVNLDVDLTGDMLSLKTDSANNLYVTYQMDNGTTYQAYNTYSATTNLWGTAEYFMEMEFGSLFVDADDIVYLSYVNDTDKVGYYMSDGGGGWGSPVVVADVLPDELQSIFMTEVPTGAGFAFVSAATGADDYVTVSEYVGAVWVTTQSQDLGTLYPRPLYDKWGATESVEPTYSGLSSSSAITGASCQFNVTVTDETALETNGEYFFETNNTGAWVADATTNFTSTPETLSVTKTLNTTVGNIVGYRFNFTDNAGNSNWTGYQYITLLGGSSPTIGEFEAPNVAYGNTYFWLNVTGNDADGIQTIKNCTVELSYGVILGWVNGTGFSEIADPGAFCTLNTTASTTTDLNATAIEVCFYLSLNTEYQDGPVNIVVTNTKAYDTAGNDGSNSQAALFQFNDAVGGGGGGSGGGEGEDGGDGEGWIENINENPPAIIKAIAEALNISPLGVYAILGAIALITLGGLFATSTKEKTRKKPPQRPYRG